jgi:GntR family transcriptional regulator
VSQPGTMQLPALPDRACNPCPRNVRFHYLISEMRVMIEFQLDIASGVATYLQLVQQVRQALQLGLLAPGDQLPTAQQVVARLAINPNTVLKAYRDLEREGLVRARPGQGTFVIGTLPRTDPSTQARFLASMDKWLASARSAGLSPDDIEAIYRTAYRNQFSEGVA